MAGEPPGRQGTGVLEGMQRIRNAGKIISMVKSCYCMWDWTTQLLWSLFYRSGSKSRERAGACQKTHSQSESRRVWKPGLSGRGSLLGMDFKAEDPRGCLESPAGQKTTLAGERGEARPSEDRLQGPPAPGCRGRRGWVGQCLAQPVFQPVWALSGGPGTAAPGLLWLLGKIF